MFRPSMRQFFRAPKSYVKAKHKRVATVDPPEECRTGGMGRFLDNT